MARVTREASVQRRRQLHAATVAELARTGVHDLALTTVADRCGVTTTTIYRRHPTRDDLLDTVMSEVLAPPVGDWLDRLAEGLAEGLDTHRRPPRAPDATVVAAWCQLCVAAAWPSPLSAGMRSVVSPADRTLGGADRDRPAAAALLVGSWLLALGLHRRPPPLTHQLRAAGHHLSSTRSVSASGTGQPDALHHRPTSAPAATSGPLLDERGRRLLLATAEAIDRVGYENVSVNAIARRAGTSTGALYNRFSGKAGLLAACLSAPSPVGSERWGPQVEALRLGPSLDPEVTTAVDAVIGRPLRARARALGAMRRDDPTAFPADIRPAAAAWVAVALPLGRWVVQRVLVPPVASPPVRS
ncbi:TetR/AcrR family transcriptional regulator [Rhabdothermincola salaria]|uniref:TetR/AcrR family transcriptional regulator n=1 Tax=Rhabdothermincola salaria TaxID=2903142 RepID=UPI001E329A97|nr:TetR/AcrR family transcriptional regulator [Rhabdothermincola salaria]MCD9623637.1 TetR/AcrR family transcriptional regulator [Rhabdothermincola salaria]